MSNKIKPNWKAAIFCKCPSCGKGRIFKGIISTADNCSNCKTDLTKFETADGPAFFAISGIGTLVGIGAGLMEVLASPPFWLHVAIWLPVIVIGSLLIIRLTKALMIAHQMQLK